jgi:hypothetical protein
MPFQALEFIFKIVWRILRGIYKVLGSTDDLYKRSPTQRRGALVRIPAFHSESTRFHSRTGVPLSELHMVSLSPTRQILILCFKIVYESLMTHPSFSCQLSFYSTCVTNAVEAY